MSRGRRAVGLGALQEALSDPTLGPGVVRALLGAPDAEVAVTDRWVTLSLEEGNALPEGDAYGKPSDYAHRMTSGDVRREVADLMVERAPQWRAYVWPFLLDRYDAIPEAVLPGMSALAGKAYREIRSTLPKSPGRKPLKPKRMPTRWEVPGSLVVTQRADGTYWCEGVQIEASDVPLLLDPATGDAE